MNMILEAKADIVNPETRKKRFCKGRKYPVDHIVVSKVRGADVFILFLFDEQKRKSVLYSGDPIMNHFVAHWNNK